MKRIFNKLFPKTSRFVRESIYTLNGWRFADLKEWISDQNKMLTMGDGHKSILLLDGLIRAYDNRKIVSNVLISPMPPMYTGVASCNLRTLAEGGAACDIVTSYNSLYEYGAVLDAFREHSVGLDVFSIELLPIIKSIRYYQNVVISIGNSDHNIFAIDIPVNWLKSLGCYNITLHLHDVCLWNLVRKISAKRHLNLSKVISDTYKWLSKKDIDAIVNSGFEGWAIDHKLVELGVYGTRVIIEMIKPQRVLVNSQRGLEMINSEYHDVEKMEFDVELGFHPVFSSDSRKTQYHRYQGGCLKIGTFGIPSHAKGTRTIIDACRILRRNGVDVRLIIAGYNAREYLSKLDSLDHDDFIEVYSDLSDSELLSIMDTVHLAVQLRLNNLGECSGVVASLAAKYCPTIVTDIGSFSEYTIAHKVSSSITPAQLAREIKNLAQMDIDHQKYKHYIMSHHPQRLCDIWFKNTSQKVNAG